MSMSERVVKRIGYGPWALLLLLVFCSLGSGQARTAGSVTTLSAAEARILVYVSPAGEHARANGFDIGMEEETGGKLNQANYYYFWVYNSKRENPYGSVTIGNYAVNKHTGQVWDTDENKEATSRLLKGVQAIIRKSHHIDEATIEEYSSARL